MPTWVLVISIACGVLLVLAGLLRKPRARLHPQLLAQLVAAFRETPRITLQEGLEPTPHGDCLRVLTEAAPGGKQVTPREALSEAARRGLGLALRSPQGEHPVVLPPQGVPTLLEWLDLPSLSDAVSRCSEQPDDAARTAAFFQALRLQPMLGAWVSGATAEQLEAGEYTTRPGDDLQLATEARPQGSFLVALTDLAEEHARHPERQLGELPTRTLLELAMAPGLDGIVIRNSRDDYVAIPKQGIPPLLR